MKKADKGGGRKPLSAERFIVWGKIRKQGSDWKGFSLGARRGLGLGLGLWLPFRGTERGIFALVICVKEGPNMRTGDERLGLEVELQDQGPVWP